MHHVRSGSLARSHSLSVLPHAIGRHSKNGINPAGREAEALLRFSCPRRREITHTRSTACAGRSTRGWVSVRGIRKTRTGGRQSDRLAGWTGCTVHARVRYGGPSMVASWVMHDERSTIWGRRVRRVHGTARICWACINVHSWVAL